MATKAKQPIVIDRGLHEKLANAYATEKLMGDGMAQVFEPYVVSDARTAPQRDKFFHRMVEEGWLDVQGHATDRAYNQVRPSKPVLSTLPEGHAGVAWANIPVEAKRWIAGHPSEYRFVWVYRYDSNPDPIEAKWGSARADLDRWIEQIPRTNYRSGSYCYTLEVSDAELVTARGEADRKARIDKARKGQVVDGLILAGLLPEPDVGVFAHGPRYDVMWGSGEGVPVAEWPEAIDHRLDCALDKIKSLQRDVEALAAFKTRVASYGGWDKFVEWYDGVIASMVDASIANEKAMAEAAKAKPAETPEDDKAA